MTSISPYYTNIIKPDNTKIKFIDTKKIINKKEIDDITPSRKEDKEQKASPSEAAGRYLLYIGGETKPTTPVNLERGQTLTPNGTLFNRHTTCFLRGDLNWSEFGDYLKERFPNIEDVDINVFGCSTGAEPYTLSFLLQKKYGNVPFKIKASDISEDVIKRNKLNKEEGVVISVWDFDKLKTSLGINADEAKRFFQEKGPSVIQIKDDITNHVEFAKANILDSLDKIDDKKPSLIFCRNMWPYIDSGEYEGFARKLYDKLAPGSVIVIGEYDLNGERDKDYLPKFPTFLAQSGFKPIFRYHSKEREQLIKQEGLPLVFEKN